LRRKTALLALAIIVVLVSSSLLVIWNFLPDENGSSAEFFVGVQLGYGGVDDCKALVDKVKNYTNLFVISSYAVTQNDADLNEVCDYIYDAGLSFIIYFEYTSVNYMYSTQNWTIQAKETYGDRYLGEYFLDEIGGKQLDMGYPHISSPYSYMEAANEFVELVQRYSADFNSGGEDFTSDYALYWFDYKAGFDTVLAAFGWNQSRQLQISQCRGAAEVQNRDWGAMLTWTYNHPPYLESGDELYEDLLLAYHSGAKYAVVFNHAEDEPYSGYGILAEEHFEALENFWNYKNGNPKKYGSLTADVAFVLPPDYGFGFRDPNDRVWRFWREHHSLRLWNEVNALLDEYGSRLDIVYSDPEFNDKIEETYDTVLRWEFEAAEGFPVRNLNTSLGYPTIQAAINSGYTLDGHVIYVTAGTYYENVVANKSVALTGEDRKTTIIDGGNVASAVKIERSASITGFTIRNGDAPPQEAEQFVDFGSGIIFLDTPSDVGAGILVDWSNCCIVGNDIFDSNYGICIRSSGNVTLRDNNIAGNGVNLMIDGESLSHFINDIGTSNTVDGKTVHYLVNEKDRVIDSSFSDVGFLALVNCTNMTVQNLNLDSNGQGILLANTTDSTVTGNSITNNQEGIRLFSSSDNVFRNNNINDNVYKLWIQDGSANDVDTSNTVDGKPVIYWVNQQSRTVPVDAGYVALINCTEITAKNLNISNNRQGILLVSTTNSSIKESHLSNNCYGIQLEECTDITISGNSIENSQENGIYLQRSKNNRITNNSILTNYVGIQIGNRKIGYLENYEAGANVDNQIVGNNITENICAIIVSVNDSGNIYYHNNLVNNTIQVQYVYFRDTDENAIRLWDNGVEGNYWSNYAGNDTNHDGIEDTEYLIETLHIITNNSFTILNITDRYPLSGMFSSFTQSGQTFNVISNSTIENFQYKQAESTITLQATTEGFGFCRVAITHTAMNKNSISVIINNGQISVLNPNYQLHDDGKTRWIYFAYPEGTQQIQITAETP
jgi:parallel beta-helix repeat protein